MKNVALYVRVSTQEQKLHGYSIDAQLEALKEYCAKNNLNIVDIYNDAGLSASKKLKNRTELSRLCADCEKGIIDTILFTKLDRWFRNIADYYQVQAILDKYNVVWRAIWEDYETETSSGRFKVNIMLSIAEAESARTSERIKNVFDYKRGQGKYVGGIPTGYIRKNGELYIDENTKEAVKGLFDTYLTTLSIKDTVTYAGSVGLANTRQSIRLMLKNPIYAGGNEVVTCEPYITKEEYSRILKSINSRCRKAKKGSKYVSILKGVCVCGVCGKNLINNYTTTKGKIYAYYMCGHEDSTYKRHLNRIKAEKLEQLAIDNIAQIIEQHNINIKLNNKAQDAEKQILKLKAKLERIGDRYEDGNITKEQYRKKTNELKAELFKLESAILDEPQPIELPDNWLDMYNSLDNQHKNQFWRSIGIKIVVTDEVIDVSI